MKLVANGIAMYYQQAGDGEPLILIHALGVDHRLWDDIIPLLSPAFRVITYDVRGHGATDVPAGPYTMVDFAEDLAGLLDALGIERAHLTGLSMGGMIAQQFAISWPWRVRSLVLADTASEYSQEGRRQLAERARIAEERGMGPLIEPTLERWFTPAFRSAHPEAVDRIRAILASANPTGYAASCRAIAQADMTEHLVNVTAPTLVLVGSEDRSTPPEMALQIHEHIPGSRYEVIAGAAHLTCVAAPAEFAQAVIATAHRAAPDEPQQ
ncbi:MAG: 3-oxoadipate enol-lactonase [Chloroflexi bacterium]|nr:3-oxoadipate enol-lactonase [Chloroflexota bacterium]